MGSELKASIKRYLGPLVTAIGFSPISHFEGTPERHHPANTCYDAKTVVVFAVAVPGTSFFRQITTCTPCIWFFSNQSRCFLRPSSDIYLSLFEPCPLLPDCLPLKVLFSPLSSGRAPLFLSL